MMSNQNTYTVDKALKKLKRNVVKVDYRVYIIITLVAIILQVVFIKLTSILDESLFKNIGSYIPVFGIILLLLYFIAKWLENITKTRWKFWVLSEVHFLQDFVEIRKFAERKNYIKVDEKWLYYHYICKKVKAKKRDDLLERLEVFEYAFEKDYEASFPEKLYYRIPKIAHILNMIFASPILFFCIFSWRYELYKRETPQFIFYMWFFFILFFFSVWVFITLQNIRALIFGYYLEIDKKGIKSGKYKKGLLVPWRDIHGIEYKQESKGDNIIDYLYIYFNYLDNSNKSYYKIAINGFKTRRDILLKEVNFMKDKYLKK